MANVKIFITGGSGMLGNRLSSSFAKSHDVIASDYENHISLLKCKTVKLDLRENHKIFPIIKSLSPQVIIHTAALTNVDYCEVNPDEAYEVNVEVTRNIAEIARQIKSKLIYISTDYVFDGKVGFYSEENSPNPVNVYAKTKLEGEQAVADACDDYIITRTCIFGWNIQNKHSFVERIIGDLKKGNRIKIFSDQVFSPIYTGRLSIVLAKMIEKKLKGLYHVGSCESVSKYDFANRVSDIFKLDDSLIIPIKTEAVQLKAKRPKNVSLRVEKIEKSLGFKMPSVNESLKYMRKEGKYERC